MPVPIYLDWNATAPPHPDVIAAMQRALESAWANPASVHAMGRAARAHVEHAREAVAALTGFHPRDVVITSGGTEANNLALFSVMRAAEPPLPAPASLKPKDRRPHAARANAEPAPLSPVGPPVLIVSRLEHPSIVRAAEALERSGIPLVWVAPSREGVVTADAAEEALLRARALGVPRLFVLQAVNHETGMIQPIDQVAERVHSHGVLLHVDAVQAVGRLPSGSFAEGADLLSVAAHKIRGPKGIGALLKRPKVRLAEQILFGGAQERGLRPGTQDAAACAGFAAAAERAQQGHLRYAGLSKLRDKLERDLEKLGQDLGFVPSRNGGDEGLGRVPHVSNLSWPGWKGDELCAALDLEGVYVSGGSACAAGTAEPSPVLVAMVGEQKARGAVRISMGEDTQPGELDEAVRRFARVLGRARPLSSR